MKFEELRKPGGGGAVIFVHGILSDGEKCWKNEEQDSYWPDLLKRQAEFAKTGIYVFTYSTGIGSGNYSIGDAVDALRAQMQIRNVYDNADKLIFVCHSMGGILVRRFIVKYQQTLAEKELPVGLFLVASPSLGSDYANFLSSISRLMGHTQAEALRFSQTNIWLNDLDKDFINLAQAPHPPFPVVGKELVEDRATVPRRLGLLSKWGLVRKQIVEPFSGARYFREPLKIPESDHITIAKPADAAAFQHQLLCHFISEMPDKVKKTEVIPPAPPEETPSEKILTEAEIQHYKSKIEALYSHLPMAGFAEPFKAPIRLDEMYIPLRAVMNLSGKNEACRYADSDDAHDKLNDCRGAAEIPLKDAFIEADKRGWRGLVILGDPGSGKTTHMKRLLLWCLHRGPDSLGLPADMLPVFLPLRELTSEDLSHLEKGLDHFIQAQLTSRHLDVDSGFGRRLMNQKKLLFLLDGLDEITDLDRRKGVSDWIQEAFRDRPDDRFIVTCRFAGYHTDVRMDERFMEFHIRPLSEEEAAEFIRNWYAIVERVLGTDVDQAESIAEERANRLIEKLTRKDFRSSRIMTMTRNPLLLTNICLVHRQRGSLPEKRSQLYDECVKVLLECWRAAKELDLSVSAAQGRTALQPAALWMHGEEDRKRATAEELAPHIDPVLKSLRWSGGDARDFLKNIRDESGLLTGWDETHYGFMHLGFQEYLAAREIRGRFQEEMIMQGNSDRLRDLAGRFGESWWQEVILLFLGMEEEPPLFIPFMRELLGRSDRKLDAEFLSLCINDAARPVALPFLDLLKVDVAADGEGAAEAFYERQFLALRMAERLDESAVAELHEILARHPYEKIRDWVGQRAGEEADDVIRSEPSGYELVLIKGGKFLMGSPEDEPKRDGDEVQHEVTLSDFYMGRYPVTNEEYGRFIAATGHREPEEWGNTRFNQDRQPVVGVSWEDAKAYADWAGLRLPTEAQWEYACRAGTTTPFWTGNCLDTDQANYDGNSPYQGCKKGEYREKTTPVDQFSPNPWGLHDMHGNVWEWCADWFGDYPAGAVVDPIGPSSGDSRVLRGGSWISDAGDCRSASRGNGSPDYRYSRIGFRLVRPQVSG